MKSFLILVAALALTTSAALAQTVAPGTAPGAQTGNPSNMPNAGSSTDPISSPDRMNRMQSSPSSSSNGDKKMMRKGKKMKNNDGTMKTKTKM